MISLEGLTLATGRHARGRLHPADVRPLRPRRPDPQPVPRGRDARASITRPTRRCGSSTRSTATSRRPATARRCALLLPTLRDIVEHHLRGTRFGIGVDPADGLLRQGAEGYQLTWMDAKVDDWVVTPRRGKAVEINALWYNALRLLEGWLRERAAAPAAAAPIGEHADRAPRVVQRALLVRARRLPLRRRRRRARRRPGLPAEPAVRASRCRIRCSTQRAGPRCSTSCAQRLLTPVGLRSLAPGAPRLQAALRRRPARARRRLSPGHGLGLADRPVHRRLAAACIPTTGPAPARCLDGFVAPPRARPASARSARSSTPRRRSRRAAASPRPGAWPRCCAPGS